VIVDDLLARKGFPHESAIGKRILARFRTPEAEWLQIIGVVAHQRDTSLAQEGREELFVPDGYLGFGAVNRWALRTSGEPLHLASAVRVQAAQIDPKLLVTEMQPMDTFVNRSQAETRFALTTMGIFALIAVLLAIIGLYGVLAAAVQQRTAEIGIRIAVGARPAQIFQLMLGQGLKLSAIGLLAGMLTALTLTRVMVSLLIGIKPTDPLTFVVIAALFSVVAMLASWLPARRASQLDSTVALRRE
jgi:putative ABC transport system permease protein